MYKPNFNKRSVVKFKHFSRHGYSLFAVLGKEVIIGVLSVATLQHATAHNRSNAAIEASNDSTRTNLSAVTLQEVNVTGTRAPLTTSQQARMVTVLTRDDIQHAAVQSVNDLLKYVATVDVRQRGALGAQTDIGIRGGNQEQITVLLNGINICDPQTGHNAFDYPIDPSQIERIEILEGPAGRVYGTSSLLGAINIVTKTPPKSSLDFHMEGGSYGYFNVGVRGNVQKGRWNNQLSTSYSRSDGFSRSNAGNLNADYSAFKAMYEGRYDDDNVLVKWHLGSSLRDFGSNTFYGVKYDDQFESTQKVYTAIQAENKKGAFHFRPSVYWNHGKDRFELFRNAPEKYPFNYHRTNVFGVNLNSYFDWALGRTAFGVEVRNEDVVSTLLGDPLNKPKPIKDTDRAYDKGFNRTNTQIFLEHNVVLDRLTVSGGVTAVKNSQAEMSMRFYPSLDMSYRIADNWKVYASYNSALRMPSFTELSYTLEGFKADKHLKPEELSALEFGVKYASKHLTLSSSVYYNHHLNLIDWIEDGTRDSKGSLIWKSVNYGVINDIGFQMATCLNFSSLLPNQKILRTLNVSYSFLHQNKKEEENISSKYTLEYLKNKVVVGLNTNPFAQLYLNLNYRFQHRMGSYMDLTRTRHKYGSYGVMDAKMSWEDKKWSAYIEANNIFSRKYMDVGNVAQPGAWVISGIQLHF